VHRCVVGGRASAFGSPIDETRPSAIPWGCLLVGVSHFINQSPRVWGVWVRVNQGGEKGGRALAFIARVVGCGPVAFGSRHAFLEVNADGRVHAIRGAQSLFLTGTYAGRVPRRVLRRSEFTCQTENRFAVIVSCEPAHQSSSLPHPPSRQWTDVYEALCDGCLTRRDRVYTMRRKLGMVGYARSTFLVGCPCCRRVALYCARVITFAWPSR